LCINLLELNGNHVSASYLPTLVVNRHVRSGQDIVYAGNVIVFGDVNPGAVIKAKGFVLVLGDLRGMVHAGAEGDEKAWVAALRLQPIQLRIAGLISCATEEEPEEPEVAQVYADMIIVRELKKNPKF
jgi:septum site-determining protein MinC